MVNKHLVIDSHAHFVPKEVAGKNTANISRKFPAAVFNRSWDIGLTVEHMDSVGIDMAVINTASRSHLGADVCRATNDGYAVVLKKYPARFIPCAHIYSLEVKSALSEVERAIKGLGLKGVAFPTSMPGLNLDSREMWPIYELISKLDVPVVIHPIVSQPLWGGERHRISITVAKEYEIAKATCEVLYGVLPYYPDLKFVMPHYGGGMPAVKGRVMAHHEPEGWKIPEELVDVGKSQRQLKQLGLLQDFDKYFDRLYFDTSGYNEWMPIMEAAILCIKKDKLCFGTDYPFLLAAPEDAKTFISNIKALKLTEDDKNLIFGGNIKNLFKV